MWFNGGTSDERGKTARGCKRESLAVKKKGVIKMAGFKNPDGTYRRYNHKPSKQGGKFADELRAKQHLNMYSPKYGQTLTQNERAYRSGYLQCNSDHAWMYRFMNGGGGTLGGEKYKPKYGERYVAYDRETGRIGATKDSIERANQYRMSHNWPPIQYS